MRGLAFLLVVGLLASLSGCGRASARESFELWPGDTLVAESPGCNAECSVGKDGRRTCVLADPECRFACKTIPECKPDGMHPVKACAIVRERR